MAIDKLNKTFESGQELLASEMNQISDKIDELVDEINTIPTELSTKSDKITVESIIGTTTKELLPNKYYIFGEVATLELTLAKGEDGKLNEYMFEFTSGTTPTVLNLPEEIKWIGDNMIEASKTYQVSIINNIAVMGGC